MGKKIAIIHHSGSGSTRTVGEIFAELLSEKRNVDLVDILPINFDFDYSSLYKYDLLIFGTPTFNCSPSRSMLEFAEKMPPFDIPKRGFLYTTYALYTGNCIRTLAKSLKEKSVITAGYTAIRGPGSDGALFFPSFDRFFNYEKRVKEKIERAISEMEEIIVSPEVKPKTPIFKWYAPLNYPNQYFGEKSFYKTRNRIKILKDRCTNCNSCVKNCIRGCWVEGDDFPKYTPANCEFCLRCIHNCPKLAIVFSEKMWDKPRLNRKFYLGMKEAILSQFKLGQ